MVTITENASRKLAELMAQQGGAVAGLRMTVHPGGCSGYQYDFTFDDTRTGDDILIEKDGARVLVDQVSLELLGGSIVDFVDGLMGSHFEIRNPNAKSSCGCGTSFSV